MFGKLIVEQHPQIVEGNLLEFSCDKCRRSTGERTFHRFDLAGRLVETTHQRGPVT